ncbi:MAG: bifunctional UDP-N-acetylglucosamine diphosphorylase/glucosamine-1-phosphate N-acetyltransferase GlmU [Wenzhouxiangellaceae bacterium]
MAEHSGSAPVHVVILAAGKGTRMRSALPKVLQPLAGRPMIRHLLACVQQLQPAQIHMVHGHGSEPLQAELAEQKIAWVLQPEQRGTGHALACAMPGIPDHASVLVLMADHPLVPLELLQSMLAAPHQLVLVSMQLTDPAGYGRIVRDDQGEFAAIVEQADASPQQSAISEVNSGIYRFPASPLRDWLQQLAADNAAGEHYLTDVLAMAVAAGQPPQLMQWPDAQSLLGANTQQQLATLERHYQRQQAELLQQQGVRLADPQRLDIRGRVSVGTDVSIDVNVILSGDCRLGDGVSIGPGCVLHDCHIGAKTRVLAHSVLEDVHCGAACSIGPFAHCRPGTRLDDAVKIGNFVETKQVRIGAHSKASHLSYLGDANLGQRVNIGAGTITCNYDGVSKHVTSIADDVFIGSDTQLVAPVSIGAGAFIGAGSTITRDAPAAQLTLSRSAQKTIAGWQPPRPEPDHDTAAGQPGSKSSPQTQKEQD